ncbi:gypsy-like retrotransposase [Cucumis melo var. makuwa]|uniref:Gypsy-like retrotransposase n=1 Tax=Cucumis melo var. makuwa TaxID=1194695 RepID=A0A5D3CXH6_CUCMM|nr:gypsy-like retrotransposase [Cucumis melo var. makuwa]TYK15958.1 gypsy-like retrotransposase [Cucumis melo var. makuwa]
MLEQLLEKQLIQLLECKQPEQAGKVDNLNYYKYHWVIVTNREIFCVEGANSKFETFEPIVDQFYQKVATKDSQLKERSVEEDNEGCKFHQDGVKKVEADFNPFTEAESHFPDAKFYLKNDNNPETVLVEIPLSEASMGTTKSMIFMDEKTPNPLILCYVPLSRCKKDESPFIEFPKGLKVGDTEVLRESFTIPLTKRTKQ